MSALALETHLAKVGRGRLRQHDIFTLEGERTVVLLSAFGMPRLWGYALDAARDGFAEGFARPHDGRVSTQLHQALDGARKELRIRVEALIERRIPDVALLAVAVERGRVHVLSAGPARAYLRRGSEVERLSPREERAEGLLKASAAFCSEDTLRGDLVFGACHTAFTDGARDELTRWFARHPTPEPSELVPQLNAKAVEKGLATAAFALRL